MTRCVGAQGQVTSAKNAKTTLLVAGTHKNPKPNMKKFFFNLN